jgi:hypothetical protein
MRRLRRAQQRHAKERKKFKHRATAAGTAAAIALEAGTNLNKVIAGYIPNNHNPPVCQDADANLLSNMGKFAAKSRLYCCLSTRAYTKSSTIAKKQR